MIRLALKIIMFFLKKLGGFGAFIINTVVSFGGAWSGNGEWL
jgi:hypothetical protein